MRSEHSWSLLDPRPVMLYLPMLDEYIVYWNGVSMTHTMALCMAMEQIGIYPSPEMKTAMEKSYQTVYYANGFNCRSWDHIIDNGPIYSYLKRIMAPHLKKVLENKEPKEILSWFDYQKARVEK